MGEWGDGEMVFTQMVSLGMGGMGGMGRLGRKIAYLNYLLLITYYLLLNQRWGEWGEWGEWENGRILYYLLSFYLINSINLKDFLDIKYRFLS